MRLPLPAIRDMLCFTLDDEAIQPSSRSLFLIISGYFHVSIFLQTYERPLSMTSNPFETSPVPKKWLRGYRNAPFPYYRTRCRFVRQRFLRDVHFGIVLYKREVALLGVH